MITRYVFFTLSLFLFSISSADAGKDYSTLEKRAYNKVDHRSQKRRIQAQQKYIKEAKRSQSRSGKKIDVRTLPTK